MENTEYGYARSTQTRPLLVKWITEKKIDKGKEESPEKMLRSLQGVFCKGRYHPQALEELRKLSKEKAIKQEKEKQKNKEKNWEVVKK